MSKYQSYSCSKLLDIFESWYEYGTDHTNYAQYLLTMQDEKEVKKLIGIYDKVLWNFILQYQGHGNEHLVSSMWYNINYVSDDTKEYWWSLNAFLNENIIRIYRELVKPTQKQSLECLLNLRKCDNQSSYQKEIVKTAIMSESDADRKQDVMSKFSDMIHQRDYSYELREKMQDYPLKSNGYQNLKNEYKPFMINLISNSYYKSIVEKRFEEAGSIHYYLPIKQWGREEWDDIIRGVIILITFLIIIIGVIIYVITEIGLFGIIICIGFVGLTLSGKIFHL